MGNTEWKGIRFLSQQHYEPEFKQQMSGSISKKDAHTEAWQQSMESQKQAFTNGAKNSAKNAKKTPQKIQPPKMIWSLWRRIVVCAKNLQKHEKKIFS